MSAVRLSASTMPIPPVSTRSKNRSPTSIVVETRSRVTPAVGSTMLIRRLASQLNSDDLPTFGRPTIATTGRDTEDLGRREWPQKSTKGTKEGGREKIDFNPNSAWVFFCALCAFLWPLFCSVSPARVAAIDNKRRTGDVTAGVAGEEDGRRAEFLRLAEATHRDLRLERRPQVRLLRVPLL